MAIQPSCRLGYDLLDFIARIETFTSPDGVLDGLHQIVHRNCELNVIGAMLLPLQWRNWSAVTPGRTAFLHASVPSGWFEEWFAHIREHPAPGLDMAHSALAPYTMSDLMQILEPLGIERWPYELALKYGMRDVLTCPVGGRWVVAFWSRKVLSDKLSSEIRAMILMGATYSAIRLQEIIPPTPSRIGNQIVLTPREIAVLRWLSMGKQLREIAQLLGLGQETVRTHLKKAQTKLGVHNRTQAVAQAIRYRLIP
ncbi:MAG: response regulator transcription factor [Dichotomicrobium sp.]